MQMELDTKTGIIQEQMEEFERLEKEMRQKTAELNEKDELINDHARVVKEYVTEIMSVKDSLENEKEATANLKQENEYFNKRIQEHKKEIEQLERKMDETVSQKNAMEKKYNEKLITNMELEAQLANLSRKLEEQQKATKEKEKEITEQQRHIKRISEMNLPPLEELSTDLHGFVVSSRRYKNTRSKSNIADMLPSLAQTLKLEGEQAYEFPSERAEDVKEVQRIVDVASEDEELSDKADSNLLSSILNIGDVKMNQGSSEVKSSGDQTEVRSNGPVELGNVVRLCSNWY
eukprot:TRINITY_DN7336_c0_g1_i11.p1 TRINITY_DN7336_c0_g1~~TRINITY_DN7336_c0_g1_i11.p1  ORF type:complete len:290 (+),score=103.89 TRINITY_DN7336_c0_g1_i11:175-1044(+)